MGCVETKDIVASYPSNAVRLFPLVPVLWWNCIMNLSSSFFYESSSFFFKPFLRIPLVNFHSYFKCFGIDIVTEYIYTLRHLIFLFWPSRCMLRLCNFLRWERSGFLLFYMHTANGQIRKSQMLWPVTPPSNL